MSVRQGNKIIAGSAKAVGISIGTIFTAPYNNYTPEGAVLADGSEFDATQFPDLWKDYIQGGRLLTCTYQEFNADVAKSGGCAKFAVNGNKFKVPMVGNGTFIAGGNGESFAESLPNIKAGDVKIRNHDKKGSGAFSVTEESGGAQPVGNGGILSFNAHDSNPTYQDGAKVQPNNIRMRYYVQVASSSVNQSMMDWSRYMQGLEGKANTDADNFTSVGKSFLASIGMPSEKFIDLSLGASGQSYIASANGYFTLDGNFDTMSVFNTSVGALGMSSQTRTDKFWRGFTLVKKGQKVSVVYTGTPSNVHFRFVYAEGDK